MGDTLTHGWPLAWLVPHLSGWQVHGSGDQVGDTPAEGRMGARWAETRVEDAGLDQSTILWTIRMTL
jgi:hypothetical protein